MVTDAIEVREVNIGTTCLPGGVGALRIEQPLPLRSLLFDFVGPERRHIISVDLRVDVPREDRRKAQPQRGEQPEEQPGFVPCFPG